MTAALFVACLWQQHNLHTTVCLPFADHFLLFSKGDDSAAVAAASVSTSAASDCFPLFGVRGHDR